MKEVLERIGLVDLFAYVCPGVIVLLSFTIWARPDPKSELWKQQALIGVVAVLLAYMIGMILSSSYVQRLDARARARDHRGARSTLAAWLWPVPAPRITPEMVEVNLKINDEVGRLIGIPGLSRLTTPWEFLVLYRTLMVDRVGDKAKTVLSEADAFHRRFRFCVGTSLALSLVALQAATRLGLAVLQALGRLAGLGTWTCDGPAAGLATWPCPLPGVSVWLLLVLIAVATLSSAVLRQIAVHMCGNSSVT